MPRACSCLRTSSLLFVGQTEGRRSVRGAPCRGEAEAALQAGKRPEEDRAYRALVAGKRKAAAVLGSSDDQEEV